jgi:hypothetical protein
LVAVFSHMGYGAAMYESSRGSGGFLDLCEKVFLIEYPMVVYLSYPRRLSFFLKFHDVAFSDIQLLFFIT